MKEEALWGGQVSVPGAVTQLEQPALGPLQELRPPMLASGEGILCSATHDALVSKIPVGKREGDAEVCVC